MSSRHHRTSYRVLAATVLAAYAVAVFAGITHIVDMSTDTQAGMAMHDCPYTMVDGAACADIAAHVHLWQTFSTGIFATILIAVFVAGIIAARSAMFSCQACRDSGGVTRDDAPPDTPLQRLCASRILCPQAP